MVARDDRVGPRPRGGVATAAGVLLAVLALGLAVRMPSAPPRLAIDVRPRPPPPSGSAVLRALDPTYLTDGPGAPLEVAAGGWTVASADGRLIAVGATGPGPILVADARTLEPIATVAGFSPAGLPRFTPEGDGLVLAGPSGGLVLHPLGAVPFPPVPLPGELAPADVVPLGGGRAAAFTVAGRVGRAMVVDLRTGSLLADVRLPALRSPSPALGWDVGRQRLYVADHAHLRVVDLTAATMVAERDLATEPTQALVAPDGTRLLLSGPQGAELYDTAGLEVIAQVDEPVARAAVSPDGRWVALDGAPRGVRLLDAATLTPVTGLGGPRRSIVGFSPGSDLLYTTGPGPGLEGSTLLAIDLAPLRVIGTRTLLGPGAWSPEAAVLSERVSSGARRRARAPRGPRLRPRPGRTGAAR